MMFRTRSVRGFSLIELLIVTAIIGILISSLLFAFSGARRSARDSRRVTDLQQAAHALDLYYLKCGMYPGRFDAGECKGGIETGGSNSIDNPSDWNDLKAILADAEIGISSIPDDPVGNPQYTYSVQLRQSGVTPRAQCYVLHALFESEHAVLNNDLDTADIEDKLLPDISSVSSKHLFPSITSCDGQNYCVGNVECFHGL